MQPATPTRETGRDDAFYVPPLLDLLGGCVHHGRDFWLGLGRLESALLAHELRAVPVTMPVFVCGLARCGSTLLHEVVTAAPGVATHRVKDYPMVFTPYWWRHATARLRPSAPRERPHRDRILITPDSPDALEEMLWLAFFPRCHDPAADNRLGADTRNVPFETFYRAHLRKLMRAERAARYAAKANYHVARLPYLVRLFPDVRLLLPVRAPAGHVASLLRQHRWFSRGQRHNPRALRYMRRCGHFEFGLDRRPLNLGDGGRVRGIVRAWERGEEVRGWARYWAMVHDYLAAVLADDARVRAAALVVSFEALCAAPADTLRAVFDHCRLPGGEKVIARFAPTIRAPDYYANPLSPADLDVIREETADAAARWGY